MTIDALRRHAEAVRGAELARLSSKLAALSPEERRAVESVTAQIVEKLVPLLSEVFAVEDAA